VGCSYFCSLITAAEADPLDILYKSKPQSILEAAHILYISKPESILEAAHTILCMWFVRMSRFISIHVNLDRKKRIEPLTINPNIQFINHIYFTKFMWSTSTSYNSMHVVCTYVSIHQHPRELGQKKEDRTPYYKSKHTVHKSHLLY